MYFLIVKARQAFEHGAMAMIFDVTDSAIDAKRVSKKKIFRAIENANFNDILDDYKYYL